MKGPLIFSAAILGFVAIAFSPRDDDSFAVMNADGSPSATQSSGSGLSFAQWSTGQTSLPRARDGHFYADAKVNGSSTRFLVDTGASVVALTGGDAQALGLYWSEQDIIRVGTGAGGAVYGIPARLERVELGGHVAENVDAVILPEGLEISLLGQSFLSTISPVAIDGDTMTLGE